eukprot:4755298-Alexandrium_andersonii.AAC.1
MELPRFWRIVLNGEKEPIAIEGHVAIAVAHLGSFSQRSGRKGAFVRQLRDPQGPGSRAPGCLDREIPGRTFPGLLRQGFSPGRDAGGWARPKVGGRGVPRHPPGGQGRTGLQLSLIHISEPTRLALI